MDLRQRDPFERKFAELIVRFRAVGFLGVLVMLVWQNISQAALYRGFWAGMSSQTKLTMDYFFAGHYDVRPIFQVWGYEHICFTAVFCILVIVALIRKQWGALSVLFMSSALLKLTFAHTLEFSEHIVWVIPAIGFVIAIISRAAQYPWGTYLGSWLLGISVAFIQLALLISQLRINQFTGFTFWMTSLLVISGFMMAHQVWRMFKLGQGLKVGSNTGVIIQWFIHDFKFATMTWCGILILLSLSFIPALSISPIFSLFYLMAAVQMAVLHLMIFPMILNVLGVFPQKF